MSAALTPAIGHNQGPVDADFIAERIISRAIEFTQWAFRNETGAVRLANLIKKRCNDNEVTAHRWVVCHALEVFSVASRQQIARHMNLNTKTAGEDYQRPKRWAEFDDEFADQLDRFVQAVIGYATLDAPFYIAKLNEWKDKDPLLRKHEKRERLQALADECRAAAETADKAAAKLLARASPKTLAKAITEEGLAALEATAKLAAGKRMRRALTSELNAAGLKWCVNAGLLFTAEPHGSLAKDPQIGLSEKGGKVYLEAVALGRMRK